MQVWICFHRSVSSFVIMFYSFLSVPCFSSHITCVCSFAICVCVCVYVFGRVTMYIIL